MTKQTGGPAFPVGSGDMRDPTGMTLRDHFAAKALQGMCANPNNDHEPDHESYERYVKEVARCAYALADAMLKERE